MSSYKPIKIAIGGEGATGKSTLLRVKNTGIFDYSCDITVGVDFACIEIPWKEQIHHLLIYDLGGQERFQFLHDSYLVGTKAAIILYDLTREKTFHKIQSWLNLMYNENPNMPIIIGGSKKDLVQKEDIIHFRNLWKKNEENWNKKFNILGHFFLSSKSNEGLDGIFIEILKKIKTIPYFPPISSSCCN